MFVMLTKGKQTIAFQNGDYYLPCSPKGTIGEALAPLLFYSPAPLQGFAPRSLLFSQLRVVRLFSKCISPSRTYSKSRNKRGGVKINGRPNNFSKLAIGGLKICEGVNMQRSRKQLLDMSVHMIH